MGHNVSSRIRVGGFLLFQRNYFRVLLLFKSFPPLFIYYLVRPATNTGRSLCTAQVSIPPPRVECINPMETLVQFLMVYCYACSPGVAVR